MGLVEQIDIQDYWSRNEVICTPFFASVMSRNRFLLILTFLHFNNNENYVARGNEGYDPLFKLGKPYRDITESFAKHYYPTKQLAVDEGLVPWRGHLHFRVYNPDKPDKFGIKSYELCDTTGYCLKYELYTGKRNDVSEFGSTYDVVMRLVEPYLNRGHHLYCDNYYTAPTLFSHLYQHNTPACGTLRVNRKHVPNAFKESKPAKGKQFVISNEPLTLVKYNDKRFVSLCTTIHNGDMIVAGKHEQKPKPICITDYNKFMGCVDRSDQMLSYMCMRRRTVKWYKKVMLHLFDLVELQAYLLYKQKSSQPVKHRVFRRDLVTQIVQSTNIAPPKPKGRPRKEPQNLQRVEKNPEEQHFLERIPTADNKAQLYRQCIVCTEGMVKALTSLGRDIPRRPGHNSQYQCDTCHQALCVTPCFKIYHTKVDYASAYKTWYLDQQ